MCTQSHFTVISIVDSSPAYPTFQTTPHFCGVYLKQSVELDSNGEKEFMFQQRTAPENTKSVVHFAYAVRKFEYNTKTVHVIYVTFSSCLVTNEVSTSYAFLSFYHVDKPERKPVWPRNPMITTLTIKPTPEFTTDPTTKPAAPEPTTRVTTTEPTTKPMTSATAVTTQTTIPTDTANAMPTFR